jgi:hypothetical protein
LSEPFPVSGGGLFQSVAHHSNQEVDQQNAVCDNKDQEEQLDEKKKVKTGRINTVRKGQSFSSNFILLYIVMLSSITKLNVERTSRFRSKNFYN